MAASLPLFVPRAEKVSQDRYR